MDGSKTAKSGQKKTKPTPEESSGDDGALQIDESAGKTIGKKQTNGGKPKKKTTNVAVPEWSVGDLVWAKVSGFVHWPAKVFDPENELIPTYLKDPPKPNYSLVRFLGTYDIQWASSRQIESYEAGMKKRLHTKSRSKLFAKALAEVKVFQEKGELPKEMTKKPPSPSDSDEEEEEEEMEEEEEEEERDEEEEEEKEEEKEKKKADKEKAPAKAGTKRKAPTKGSGRGGGRKVKILDTEEENGEKKT